MKHSRLLAVAAFALFTVTAQAQTDTDPTYTAFIKMTPPDGLSATDPWTGSFSDAPTDGSTLAAGRFIDSISFSFYPYVDTKYIWTTLNEVAGLTITSISLTFYGDSTPIDLSSFESANNTFSALTNELQPGAAYTFLISGYREAGVALSGSVYAGATPIAAVPEPSAWALMVAGLLTTGLLTRTRRQG